MMTGVTSRAPDPPPGNEGATKGPAAHAPVRRVSLLMRTLTTEMQVYAELVCTRLDINRSDLTALGHLEKARVEGHAMTQADLGRALRMSGAAITALADRLQRTGHLVRIRSGHDRRKILLEATEQSRETSLQCFRPLAHATTTALQRYTPQELELVERVMIDLVEAAREASQQVWRQQDGSALSAPPRLVDPRADPVHRAL